MLSSVSGIAAYVSRVAFQKHQALRDEKDKLESELAEDAASAEDKALHLQVQISELQSKNDELEQRLGAHRAEREKCQMSIEQQDSEADRLGQVLQEYTEYRDGIIRDLKTMTQYLQKAEMMQLGAC